MKWVGGRERFTRLALYPRRGRRVSRWRMDRGPVVVGDQRWWGSVSGLHVGCCEQMDAMLAAGGKVAGKVAVGQCGEGVCVTRELEGE